MAFVWGDGGAQLTPEAIAAQRKVAQAMMARGGDYSPVQSGWQGAARLAEGLTGGFEAGQADSAERRNAAAERELLASLIGGGATAGAVPAAMPATVSPAVAETSGAVALPPPSRNVAPGRIYSNDEPSPLDPPSGQDRARMMATIIGEADGQPAIGQNAVASLIRNRAVNGGYGGNTPSGVVTAKNQFEPWNTEEGRARMARGMANPALAAKADQAIALAYGEGGQAPADPTNGAVNFIQPKLQTALGREMPAWAQKPGTMIGDHKFIGGATQPLTQAPYDVAGPAVAPPQDPASLPPNAQPAQGYAIPGQPSPAVQTVAQAMPSGVNPKLLQAMASPYVSDNTKKVLGVMLAQQMKGGETDEIKEYNLDVAQRKARGDAPMSFFDFKSGIKKAGATNVTTNVDKGEDSFAKAAGTAQAKRFDDLASDGQQAQQMISDINTLTDLGKNIGTGKSAELKAVIGPYAESLGIKVEGLSDIQAYEAVVNRVAPSLRVKGSGAQSDLELKNFLKSLPSLGNTPEGNNIASSVLKGLQENKILAAEIGAKALNREITRTEAEKQLRSLPDPMTQYREYMKTNRGAPTSTGTKPAATETDRSAIEAEMKRRGLLK